MICFFSRGMQYSIQCVAQARYVDEIADTIEEGTSVAEDPRVLEKKNLLTECGNRAVAELGYYD